jgi:hypothetical protein
MYAGQARYSLLGKSGAFVVVVVVVVVVGATVVVVVVVVVVVGQPQLMVTVEPWPVG